MSVFLSEEEIGCPTPTECRASKCHGGCLKPSSREAAEHAYYHTAFDYASNPVGSRDWSLFWRGWQAYEQTGLHKPSDVVADLSKTVMRLALALRRADPKNDFADKALDYLKRKKLTSPLRPMGAPFHPQWGVAIGSETPSFTDKPVRWMSREDWDAGWKQSPVYQEPLADDDVPLYARPQGAVSKSAPPTPPIDALREIEMLACYASEEDIGARETVLTRIGEIAREFLPPGDAA